MNKTLVLIATTLACFLSAGAQAVPIKYVATLSGAAEAVPNQSPGTGFVTVLFDDVAHTLHVKATFADLLGLTTAAHIHCCTAAPFAGAIGVASQLPTYPGFPGGVSSGMYDSAVFDLTLASSWNPAFITANGGTAAGAEAKLALGLASGSAYFNIHSSQFGGGEIRGFLVPKRVPEPTSLALMGLGLAGLGLARRRKA